MTKIKLLSYEDVLGTLDDFKTRHVLLGNGFSRACRDKLFAYDALYEQAKKLGLSAKLQGVFGALATTDFEAVMKALRQSAILAETVGKGLDAFAKELRAHADELRELLVKTIAGNHPGRPHDIKKEEYGACRKFLKPFGKIYTLNYDLLLYWTAMQGELLPPISIDDGFREPDDGPEEYVTWNVENSDQQNTFYLHGALHLFDAGHELQKYTWCNTGVALVDQIRKALKSERYPHFVSEGTSEWKLNRIQHSGYLNRGLRSFAAIGGALVVYGHSMAANDEHIIKLIESRKCKIEYLAVGLYGDPASSANDRIVMRCNGIIAAREAVDRTTILDFFDAASAEVWG